MASTGCTSECCEVTTTGKDDLKTTFISDNSDNTFDELGGEKTETTDSNTKPAQDAADTKENDAANSNNGNLLEEAKPSSTTGNERNAENENYEDDDDDDVEIIENDSSDNEDDEEIELTTVFFAVAPCKRTHNILDKEDSQDKTKIFKDDLDTEAENSHKKKLKTDKYDAKTTEEVTIVTSNEAMKIEKIDLTTEIKVDNKSNKILEYKPIVKTFKAVPSEIPVSLYPPPRSRDITAVAESFKLNYFKRFNKTFDKMTKKDLEELVVQKLVEVIVHKSEFAEMRETIEQQEKIIALHRMKIAELSKQFRDLELVHNRVVKNMQAQNSKFIMPAKITRAVGLQVNFAANRNQYLYNTATSTSSVAHFNLTKEQHTSAQRRSSSINSMQRPDSSGNAALASATRRTGCISPIFKK